MTRFAKGLVGVATAAMMVGTAAAPAQAQYYGYNRYYDRDRGVDAGDIIAGVAVIGGIAAIAAAISNDGGRYGYDYRDRYRNDYTAAVNSCAYTAERYGQVRINDVDRTGANRYRVTGTVDRGGYGYDRYDRYGGRYFTCSARTNGRVTNFRLG